MPRRERPLLAGNNCLDIWQFFRNFLAFQRASFQHFTSTIGTALPCEQWFFQAGRCATKEEKPLRATVCFSIEHARPRDITFSCFARNISKTTTLHVLHNFLFISFRFYKTKTYKKMSNFAFFMENVNKQGEILFSFESGYGP